MQRHLVSEKTHNIYSGLSLERHAELRRCLNEEVVITADCVEYHHTTYASFETIITRLFAEGHTAIYSGDMCIAMHYARHKPYPPEAAHAYAQELIRGGCPEKHVSALLGIPQAELIRLYGRLTKKTKGRSGRREASR